MVFTVALYALWCRHLESLKDISPQLYADNLKRAARHTVKENEEKTTTNAKSSNISNFFASHANSSTNSWVCRLFRRFCHPSPILSSPMINTLHCCVLCLHLAFLHLGFASGRVLACTHTAVFLQDPNQHACAKQCLCVRRCFLTCAPLHCRMKSVHQRKQSGRNIMSSLDRRDSDELMRVDSFLFRLLGLEFVVEFLELRFAQTAW